MSLVSSKIWVQGEVDVLVELISKENGLADKFLEDMQGVCSAMVAPCVYFQHYSP